MSELELFASRLRYAMQLRGVRQKDVAEATKLPSGTINNYCTGRYDPKINNLLPIAEYLKVDAVWLMGFDVPMEKNKNEIIKKDETHILVSSFEKLSQDDKEFVLNMINKLSKK